jgi:hypothetical protein
MALRRENATPSRPRTLRLPAAVVAAVSVLAVVVAIAMHETPIDVRLELPGGGAEAVVSGDRETAVAGAPAVRVDPFAADRGGGSAATARPFAAAASGPGLRLTVRCIDRRTGERVGSGVRLERVDGGPAIARDATRVVEGTASWAAEGPTFENLEPGRYRIMAKSAVFDAEPEPEFELVDRDSTITLALALPTLEPAWLRVYDEFGNLLDRGTLERVGVIEGEESDGRFRGYHSSPTPAIASVQGFALGRYVLDHGTTSRRELFRFTADAERSCRIAVSGRDRDEARCYVGVVVSRRTALARVVLPDDADVASLHGVSLEPLATSATVAKGERPWLRVPVRLRIDDPRFEPCDVVFELNDGPPFMRLLRRGCRQDGLPLCAAK